VPHLAFTFSRASLLYAMSRTSTAHSESRRALNGSPVVVIGVDRHGVGRDNSARLRLPYPSLPMR
jgi:hypothetical protein